ncbi:stomatin-like [Salvelinus sp. IW2-2015]|uniref:stomatin-like n=1 Tax=Salvelinus sp. IW2-2015 TaxID=2691554 RepID=UPI0038D42C66
MAGGIVMLEDIQDEPKEGDHMREEDVFPVLHVVCHCEDDQVFVLSRAVASHTDVGSGSLGCCGWLIVILSGLFVFSLFPFTIWFCIKIVQEYERAVIFRLGRITDRKAKGPGIFFVLPCTDSFVKVDLRTVSFDIPPQEVIAAEGEMNASRALKEASLVISESPSGLQLRYLQTLTTIAAEKNSTIIFPLPMDVISHFMKK